MPPAASDTGRAALQPRVAATTNTNAAVTSSTAAPVNPASRLGQVLVTRPAQDAGQWVKQLQQQGFRAQALPLIEIGPVLATAHVQALSYAWQAIDSYTACMFVSGNAVEHFFKQKESLAQYRRSSSAIKKVADSHQGVIPLGLRFLAPGPGTVAALLAAGVPGTQIDTPGVDAQQFDSEALWQVVGQRNWQGARVLVVRGRSQSADGKTSSHGRDWITRQWQAAGAVVDAVSVYERRAPVFDARQLKLANAASSDGSIWLFSSSEALTHLDSAIRAASGNSNQPAPDWRHARAIATHPRIAATVRAMGWGDVVESRPALEDIVDTLHEMAEADAAAAGGDADSKGLAGA